MPAPPPESEPAMVRALGMDMKGNTAGMCLEANAAPRRTYREPIIPSFPRKRESRAFPGILDSRFRGSDASKVPLFSRELKASFVVRLGAALSEA